MGRFDGVSAFEERPKRHDPDKTDILFNEPGQGSVHGHVAQSEGPDGDRTYHYVRDHEGDPYIDDNPNSSTYTGGGGDAPTAEELEKAQRQNRERLDRAFGRGRRRR